MADEGKPRALARAAGHPGLVGWLGPRVLDAPDAKVMSPPGERKSVDEKKKGMQKRGKTRRRKKKQKRKKGS